VATGLDPVTPVFAFVFSLLATLPVYALVALCLAAFGILGGSLIGFAGLGLVGSIGATVGLCRRAVARGLRLEPDRLELRIPGRRTPTVMLRHVTAVEVVPRQLVPFLAWTPLRALVLRGPRGQLASATYLPTLSRRSLEHRLARAAKLVEERSQTLRNELARAADSAQRGDLQARSFALHWTATELGRAANVSIAALLLGGVLLLCGWNSAAHLVSGSNLWFTIGVVALLGVVVGSTLRLARAAARGCDVRLGVDGVSVRVPSGGWVMYRWPGLATVAVLGTPRWPPRAERGCLLIRDAQDGELLLGPFWTWRPRHLEAKLQEIARCALEARQTALAEKPPALLELVGEGATGDQVQKLARRAHEAYRGGPAGRHQLETLLLAPHVGMETRTAAALALALLGPSPPDIVKALASPVARLLVARALSGPASSEARERYLAVARRFDAQLADRSGAAIPRAQLSRLDRLLRAHPRRREATSRPPSRVRLGG